MTLPNFFIIGAPKCGTTALFRQLSQHPNVYPSPMKEPHFFSFLEEGRPPWAIRDLVSYEQLFSDSRENHTHRGEASTWYLYSRTAAKQIHRHIPDARLIALLRNPATRAYSSFTFRRQMGWEDLSSFEKALQEEEERIKQDWEWDFHYARAGFYGEQLSRYFELFPREQILVLIHEEFRSEPGKCLSAVCQFLGLDESFNPDVSRNYNVTQVPRSQLLNRFFAHRNLLKDLLKAVLPERARDKLAKARAKNLRRPPPIDSKTERRLLERYRDDIRLLEELLERDLSIWYDTSRSIRGRSRNPREQTAYL